MTYKDIVNRFREVAFNHLQIQDFGYGELSDIKTQSQGGAEADGADYPYMFLNPGSHSRTRSVVTYSFNIIMMDMAREEEGDVYDNYLTIQSQCQQYLDDVIANMYYGFTDKPDINLTNITYTPFKEKYQDVLAGMTASIQIEVPISLDNCIAPFGPNRELIDILFGTGDAQGTWINSTPLEAYCQWVEGIESWDGTILKIWSDESIEVGTQLYQSTGDPVDWDMVVTYNFSDGGSTLPKPDIPSTNLMVTVVNGIVTEVNNFNEFTCPADIALDYTRNTPSRLFNNTAAFGFEIELVDENYFVDGAYSNWYFSAANPFQATAEFTGVFTTYPVGFVPSEWKLGIFDQGLTQYVAISDNTFPEDGVEGSLTFSEFTYPESFGNQYVLLYKIGDPLDAAPVNHVTRPFYYSGNFKILAL